MQKKPDRLELGQLIFDNICKYASTRNIEKMGLEFINVNLSPVQFQDLYLVNSLKKISDSYNLKFSTFDFEITETSAKQLLILKHHVEMIKSFGGKISLDDFGKGDSNIERLLTFPFSVAKLDMELVWSYFNFESKLLKDVINIFKAENLDIVAEGVEDKGMAEGLIDMGCDYLQGYYFSKPLPQDEFDKYVCEFNEIEGEVLKVK